MQRPKYRWSDNDRYFGNRVLYAREKSREGNLAFVLKSHGSETPVTLRMTAFGHTIILSLPDWVLHPTSEEIYLTEDYQRVSPEEAAHHRTQWYKREYGFNYSNRFLQVYRGRSTDDSSTDRSWGMFMPWGEWRGVRTTFYGRQGEVVFEEHKPTYEIDWQTRQKAADASSVVFAFQDYDGEWIDVTAYITEDESAWGVGKWKWLSWFRKNRISRRLDLNFSKEVGRRKGTYKGGTVGHSIEMRADENHEMAFRRYCSEHDLTFGSPNYYRLKLTPILE